MRWTIPNILTVLRVLAAPGVGIVFLLFDRPQADWIALWLFVIAALTDYVDGWMARRYAMGSAFGKMLDPIADKVMVVIAAAVLMALWGLNPFILIPLLVILMREVLVSGLREFLGDVKLDVTRLAKWKTTAQLVAIAVILWAGAHDATHSALYLSLDPVSYDAIRAGQMPDDIGLNRAYVLSNGALLAGLILLWLAAALTAITGWDYFSKARPYLRGDGA